MPNSPDASSLDVVAPRTAKAASDPWSRWGRLLGSAWIFFLGYSVLAALNAPVASWLRYGTVALLVAFAVVYVASFTAIPGKAVLRHGGILAVLIAITVAVSPVIGIEALGCGVFVMAYAILHLPLRAAFGVAGGVLAVMILAAWWSGEFASARSILLIALIVGLFTGITRMAIEASLTRKEVARRQLAAQERERLARDVHDVLAHTLTVVLLKAELAGKLIDTDPQRARDEIDQVQVLSREAIAELRSTVGTLRARQLVDELQAANEVLTDAGISAKISGDAAHVDPRFQPLFSWVVREAVTNVVRHSGATTCTITVAPDEVRISDDGRGLGQAAAGNGLRGLTERVAEAGGVVSVNSPTSGGTQIAVSLARGSA